ncbi:Pumilio-12-like protein [Morus notabilis]|uniref:Pumilio-12-like protein n=1 Tax=Morus notabilis TaxID=981085 RepID=W9R953_9ROSA|nr:pumilio homolog 12 [Morus notabilis]EXB76652.1 Pumilio-12-like protein [Morus notabilis]
MEQQNNLAFSLHSELNNRNRQVEPRRLIKLSEMLFQVEQELNELWNIFFSASPSLSLSVPQFPNSEPMPTTRINSPATPPYSPLAAATNGTNINESPVYSHSHSPRNYLNLPRNLFDDDNGLMIQYSQSHDHSLHHRSSSSQSPDDHQYDNHQPNSINAPYSLGYNGFGPSGLQRREISSPQLYNADYYHQYGRYHYHNNLPRRHQYQNFSPVTPIDVIRGKVVMAAQNQHGSRFLQDKLRHGNPQNIDVIFSETKWSLWFLMEHQFGNHVVQKLIDVVDDNKLDEILHIILTEDDTRLSQLCTHDHGTKVVQKLVGRLSTPDDQYLFASVVSRIALSLTRSTNGNAVIYQCLRNFFRPYKKLLLQAIAQNSHDIAQDKSGCCILQKCFVEADGEIFDMLAAPIIEKAYTLSHVISMKKQEVNRKIAAKFTGKFFSISMNKYGSNVVENLMKNSGLEEAADSVISEILASDSPLLVSQDRYGNFVVQSAIRVIREGQLLNQFIQHVEDNAIQLHNHMYGNRVLQAVNARRNG